LVFQTKTTFWADRGTGGIANWAANQRQVWPKKNAKPVNRKPSEQILNKRGFFFPLENCLARSRIIRQFPGRKFLGPKKSVRRLEKRSGRIRQNFLLYILTDGFSVFVRAELPRVPKKFENPSIESVMSP
jgi:hypothetical protein